MDRKRIIEVIEKCKDKIYIETHKELINEVFKKKSNLEIVKNELNTKRNLLVLSILENIECDYENLVPNFENKKYITQYMYTSMYWLYKNNLITPERFTEIQEQFSVMKNCEKMFEDTSQQYKEFRISNDRKFFKQLKGIKNKIEDRKEEIAMLIEKCKPLIASEFEGIKWIESVSVFTVILNVDEFFDLSALTHPEAEEGKSCIGEIKNAYTSVVAPDLFSLSKLQCIDPDSDQSLEDIPEEKELSGLYTNIEKKRSDFNRRVNFTFKFSNLDRVLQHRLSKLHGLVTRLQKNDIEVYIVSCVSLTQLLAEITFFEFSTMELCNIFSLRSHKEETYNKMFSMITGRIIIFGENKPIKRLNTFLLDFKYLKDLTDTIEEKNKDQQ